MIRRKQSARTVQRVVDNFERLSGLNKFSLLSSCSRSDKEGLLINGPYQMSDMLMQHESKDRLLSCEKEPVYCFDIFYALSFYAQLLKSWGSQGPPFHPPVFDAPESNILIRRMMNDGVFSLSITWLHTTFKQCSRETFTTPLTEKIPQTGKYRPFTEV